MIYAVFDKLLTIVLIRLIQPNYMRHSKVAEYLKIIFWCISMLGFSWNLLRVVNRTHKCYELPWNNPVQVSILDLFIVLVFPWIKILEAVPTQLIRNFKALQAMINL